MLVVKFEIMVLGFRVRLDGLWSAPLSGARFHIIYFGVRIRPEYFPIRFSYTNIIRPPTKAIIRPNSINPNKFHKIV